MKRRRIKVCLICPLAYPLFNPKCKKLFGGAEVQIFHLAKKLSQDLFDVSVIVADYGQKSIESYGPIKLYKSFKFKKSISNYFFGPILLYQTLKKIRPDIVVQRCASAETGIAYRYCKRHKKKFVYSAAHEVDVNGDFKKKFIVGRMFYYGLKNASLIVLQSQDQLKSLVKDHNFRQKNLRIIRNSLLFDHNKINFKKDCVLWVAKSDSWKQPEIFLELARRFPTENFIMIMPKSSDLDTWKRIKFLASNSKNLQFIERVPFDEINKYYKRAKIFVNTSFYEGYPNTFIQAAMNQTPILSLKVDPDGLIKKYKIGFSCNDSLEDFFNNFKLLNQPMKIEEYGKNGINFFREEHDLNRNFLKWKHNLIRLVSR